nr:immunoglobulin light chain junction region [Macaca mulatta]MOX77708.1 immunoglobulin light chain junction region [Macaca mulatta]MOX78157.1 immunoglobulin light chain junction region [Macaca mulatta]MOX78761.1 immunoglobulin light chain junction region [Macaca mulatta]MOX78881.1 immunoglobulin light chain junction region [Macaca mulatta]
DYYCYSTDSSSHRLGLF